MRPALSLWQSVALLATLLAALLAGCTTPPAPEPTDPSDATAPEPGDGETPAEASAPERSIANASTETFSWDGHFGTGTYVYMSDPVPAGSSLTPTGMDTLKKLKGNVTAVDFTLTWTATSPTTEEIFIRVAPYQSCGTNCYTFLDGDVRALGASPLIVRGAISPPASADGTLVFVFPVDQAPVNEVFATAIVEQPWSIRGTYTTTA